MGLPGLRIVHLLFHKEERLSEQKFTVAHNYMTIDFNGAVGWDHIDMNGGVPIRASEFGIRVAKGNVQAGHLFILQ